MNEFADPSLQNPLPESSTATTHWGFVLCLLFGCGMIGVFLVQQFYAAPIDPTVVVRDADVDASIPSPDYAPNDVVRLQMDSLLAFTKEPDQLRTCYSLASPSNRFHVGSLRDFQTLVRAAPYDALLSCQEYQVGTPVYQGEAAAVLVSILTKKEQAIAFRFLLIKQDEVPYVGCWMTEGVFPVSPPSAQDAAMLYSGGIYE